MASNAGGPGDIDISCTYNGQKLPFRGVSIIENILDPLGYKADIKMSDTTNSFTGLSGADGDKVSISVGGRSFNLAPTKHANMHDGTKNSQGSGKSTDSTLQCSAPQALNVHKKQIKKSFNNLPTTEAAKKVMEESFQTPVEVRDPSSNKKTVQFKTEAPMQCISKLNNEHKSTAGKSSTYAIYQEDDKTVMDTYDNMMKKPAVASFIKRSDTNFGASAEDIQGSILEMNVDSGFNAERRGDEGLSPQTYNLSTGSLYNTGSSANGKQRRTMLDKINSPSPHETAQARADKSEFLSKLNEKHGTIKVYGNPAVKIGTCINVDPGETPGPISGKCLVVSVQHDVADEGVKPRYTQTIGVIPVIS